MKIDARALLNCSSSRAGSASADQDARRLAVLTLLLSAFICIHPRFVSCASAGTDSHFQKQWLSAQFFGEGANTGDFNHDGKPDVISGPFIYDGPDFKNKHTFMDPVASEPLGYSKNFFAFSGDFNGDGWDDIFIIGFPGEDGSWYENPKEGKSGNWTRHLALKVVDNESPTLTNFVGDEKPELVCMSGGYAGYATPDAADPTKPWTFHPITPKGDYGRFTHGIGVGDVNGDGRLDLLEKTGWWEQPEKLEGDPAWKKHAFHFAPGVGSSQMYAYDVDGDGDNDVICALNAHGFGLAWYEQVNDGGKITFKQHLILSPKGDEKIQDVQFSQLHALDLVDMDGDGVKDIVTGKRYWAHGPTGDVDATAPAVLYWFKTIRDPGKASGSATFEPHLIDDDSGVGTQIVAADINGDKKPDVIVGNKKGTILLLSK